MISFESEELNHVLLFINYWYCKGIRYLLLYYNRPHGVSILHQLEQQ